MISICQSDINKILLTVGQSEIDCGIIKKIKIKNRASFYPYLKLSDGSSLAIEY